MRTLAAVFAGGCAGALVRAGLAEAFPAAPGTWPWVTLAVNVAGAFILGYVATRAQAWLPLVGAGFCGALTTFSTLQVELLRMFDADRYGRAALYLGVSIVLGYGAVALATSLGRR
jgi:CrcB protein